jgi:hypothetical protein
VAERVGAAGEIDLHRVVDHQVHGHERLDDLRILAHAWRRAERMAARSTSSGTPGEVLQHDAGDDEGNLRRARRLGPPVRQVADRALGHALAVAVAQHRLEHQPDRHGQARRR